MCSETFLSVSVSSDLGFLLLVVCNFAPFSLNYILRCKWSDKKSFELHVVFAALALSWPAITLLFVSLLASTSSIDGLSGSNKHRREVIVAHHGVVATDDGRCSKIGMDVLKAGGHAVDASVAVALCLGVVSPASSGIGGGSFMLIRQSDGKAQALDMRETAPAQASEVLMLNIDVSSEAYIAQQNCIKLYVSVALSSEYVWRQ